MLSLERAHEAFAVGVLPWSGWTVLERALQGELTEHLGYAKGEITAKTSGNARNGSTSKSLKGGLRRDRAGHATRSERRVRAAADPEAPDAVHRVRREGAVAARGMTTREIQGHLEEMYGTEVSPSLISDLTEGVLEQAKAWQSRPLKAFYPVVFVALGINLEGQKAVLGLWTGAGEGSRFWWEVLIELRNRGVKDIYVACVEGLRGFPQAIETIFPKAQVQLCIVPLIRNSLNSVTWKDLRAAASDLKPR